MIGTIWQRYIFCNLLKGFLFFLLSFFLLYSLIDFSTHAQDFITKGSLNFSKLSFYYSYQLVKRLELLLPLALLISVIRVLTTLNDNKELVALQVAGLPLKKIFKPFFLLAIFCSFLGYCNEEIFIPKSATYFTDLKYSRTKNPLKKFKNKQFTILPLEDSSKLIYQNYNAEKNAFFDVYWISSFQDIWRMKYLNADPNHPVGEYVDHLVRNKEGFLENVESFEKKLIPDLKWTHKQLNKKQSSIKHQKISHLAHLIWSSKTGSLHVKGEIETYFFYKLIMPLLSFLVLIGVLPFCIKYSRTPPLFMIYGPAIFCFVVFFTLMNAMTIIAENNVLPPYIAICAPLVLFLGATYKRFYTLI
ncbi:MAG: LptF/LptG family permease [Chlamydiota bacterium]